MQDEWDAPRCLDWVSRLTDALTRTSEPVVLAAHSAGCAMVAHWAASVRAKPDASRRFSAVRGALLVAPSDPTRPNYPRGPVGFAPVPLARLPFPTLVVASDNDPYVTLECAREYAAAWGASLEVLEGAGHINTASGHGAWAEGFNLLDQLRS
jgi:predicted alpha/beta hydrolase family esterase